jgi:hypothetical protein
MPTALLDTCCHIHCPSKPNHTVTFHCHAHTQCHTPATLTTMGMTTSFGVEMVEIQGICCMLSIHLNYSVNLICLNSVVILTDVKHMEWKTFRKKLH